MRTFGALLAILLVGGGECFAPPPPAAMSLRASSPLLRVGATRSLVPLGEGSLLHHSPASLGLGVSAQKSRTASVTLKMGAENGVVLPSGNVEQEVEWLADEITQWLDDEWIERDVHRDIGERAGAAYASARGKGIDEVGNILCEVAADMMTFDFYEADVAAFDIANKVADLLLINDGRDVCCTSAPYNSCPPAAASATTPSSSSTAIGVPAEAVAFSKPESAFERYAFLQEVIDGRANAAVVDRAVLESLGFKVEGGKYENSGVDAEWAKALGVPRFLGDADSCEKLLGMLESKMDAENREVADLDGVVEALVGEAAMNMYREEGDVDFAMREACVKWLHYAGGY